MIKIWPNEVYNNLKEWLSSVHISEEQSEYQEESKEQDIQEIESEANETDSNEELNELSDTLLVKKQREICLKHK